MNATADANGVVTLTALAFGVFGMFYLRDITM
jgi:hypothetical protein